MLHDHDSCSRCESTRTSRCRHVHPSVERSETWLRGVRSKYCVADDRKSRTSSVRSGVRASFTQSLTHTLSHTQVRHGRQSSDYDTAMTRNRYDMELRKAQSWRATEKSSRRLYEYRNCVRNGELEIQCDHMDRRTFFYIRAGKNPRQYVFFSRDSNTSNTQSSNRYNISGETEQDLKHFVSVC